MVLTDRDNDIVRAVADLRFMTRDQISRLLFPALAESVCKRRLTLLYHGGFLDRLHLPVAAAYGSSKAVYYLDQAGVRLLWQQQRLTIPWRRRDGKREIFFLDHTLDINDVCVAVTLTSRRHNLDLEWLDERELRRRGVVERFRGHDGRRTVILPDAYFALGREGLADGFALEVDRATVPEKRMRARMRGYGEWAASGSYRSKLPTQSFRVIFAVTGTTRDPKRLEHVKRWCEEEGGGSLFWFINREGLDADALDSPVWWVAGDRSPRRLPLSAGLLRPSEP